MEFNVRAAKFRCPGCGKELVSIALCLECENKAIAAEEYERLFNDISVLIRESKRQMIEAVQKRVLHSTGSIRRKKRNKKRKPMKK